MRIALTLWLAAAGCDAAIVIANPGPATPTDSGVSEDLGATSTCGNKGCEAGEDCTACPADCPCPSGQVCIDGACVDACGDGACGPGEDNCTCPADCPASCGDGCCAGTETECDCAADCADVCGDGCCTGGETPCACAIDCTAVCGDSCCTGEEVPCNCPRDCTTEVCTDGCCTGSETSATCAADCPSGCDGDGICDVGEYVCGCPTDGCPPSATDTCCSPGETRCTEADCLAVCGDGCCTDGETPCGCPADCPGCDQWARGENVSADGAGVGVAVLPDGSTLMTGYFGGDSAVFGQGEPNETALPGYGNDCTLFLAKYSAAGSLTWAKDVGTVGNSCGDPLGCPCHAGSGSNVVAVPWDGGALVRGEARSDQIFGAGEPNEITFPGGPYLAKYGGDGVFMWIIAVPPYADVAAGPDGGALLGGPFVGTETFGAGEPGETTLTSAGYEDIFVARYGVSGALQWARRAGSGADNDQAVGIAALPDGATFVTGHFTDAATFGEGEPGETTIAAAGYSSFIARYGASGVLQWAKAAGGVVSQTGNGIAVLPDAAGGVFVTGSFRDSAIFGEGEAGQTTLASAGYDDIFIAAHAASDGTLRWAKRAGGSYAAEPGDKGYGVAASPGGRVFVTGVFSETATFGPGEPRQTTLSGYGTFVAAYEASSGALAWAKQTSGAPAGYAVAHSGGCAHVAGECLPGATFFQGEPAETMILIDSGGYFPFLARFCGDP